MHRKDLLNVVCAEQEGTLAAYSMFRGFLNAMDQESDPGGLCSKLAICEGAR
jgi:hypothetical protein